MQVATSALHQQKARNFGRRARCGLLTAVRSALLCYQYDSHFASLEIWRASFLCAFVRQRVSTISSLTTLLGRASAITFTSLRWTNPLRFS